MNTIKIIGICILFIFLIVQIIFVNKINNQYDILQVNNPNKDNFEKMIAQRSPCVFTGIIDTWDIRNLNIDKLNKLDLAAKNKLNTDIDNCFNYYLTPMCLKHNFRIDTNEKTNLVRENSFRHLICQISGTSTITLFSPNENKFLYPSKKNGITKSQIDYWNQDLKMFPKFNDAKCIDIILYPGHMLYIPYKWWYVIECENEGIQISCTSESSFSYFFKF